MDAHEQAAINQALRILEHAQIIPPLGTTQEIIMRNILGIVYNKGKLKGITEMGSGFTRSLGAQA